LKEGTVNVEVSYKDPMGNTLTTTFTVRSTFFPFAKEYITTNLFSDGTYTESTHTFKTGQYGQMGWEYREGADWSDYKYLVIKLKRSCSGAHLNLFTAGSIWSDCYSTADFGSKKQIVVKLQTIKYTSGNKQGQAVDLSNIRIVSFWADYKSIVVDDMYLTNNDDYSPGEPDAIDTFETVPEKVDVYTIAGICVRRQADAANAFEGLRPGIYVVGGKKVRYDGRH
jgi:hypothetical protein